MSQVPEFFGKYILLEKLATGGMAEVYLCKSLGAENVTKIFAMKRILPQYSQNREFVEMFKEEARIAINLSHSNIVSIFEFGEERGQFYLVMEYVEGRNLRQILNRLQNISQKFRQDFIVYATKECALGLDHAHRCVDGTTGKPLNISHRDISPQNVMINFEGEVKICDFGIAKAESRIENTQAGILKGKFSYMSPEQAEGQEVDFRSDIFSLGVVLWELLAQERLFQANNEMNTLRKIRDCQVKSLRKVDPNIPVELERITNKALARDRNLRYQSSAEFHRDLNRFLNRQFPDFSPHDFSTFIKQLYSKEREDNRRRMIEYAKIQPIPDSKESTEASLSIHTVTEASSSMSVSNNQRSGIVNILQKIKSTPKSGQKKRQAELPQNLTHEAVTVNPDKVDFKAKLKPGDILRPVSIKDARRTIKKLGGSHSDSMREESHSSYTVGDGYFEKKAGKLFSTFLMLLFFTLSVGVFYLYIRNHPEQLSLVQPYIAELDNYFGVVREPAVDKKETPVVPIPSIKHVEERPEYRIFVTSTPPGADIYINGQDMKTVTPGQVSVLANQGFTLKLLKEGYIKYEAQKMASIQGQTFKARIKRADIGFINIIVHPSTAVILIDNKKLPDTAPLNRYPVQAGVPIRVTAYDPLTKTFAEDVITVRKDSVYPLTLFLKKRLAESEIEPLNDAVSTQRKPAKTK